MLPAEFLLGAATSSHQVEGGNRANDWSAWETRHGAIADGSRSGRAADWWAGQAEEDLRRAASLGQNAHRMSLEWSRIEPEPGRFDDDALARYCEILDAARRLELTILLTLNHFTLPRWAADRGSWAADDLPARFGAFAGHVAKVIGEERVALWATLNEPSVLAYMGYAGHRWPPGSRSMTACFKAIRQMLHAHVEARMALRRQLEGAQVGLVVNCPWFVPARPGSRLDQGAARAQDWAFSGAVIHALRTGVLRFPLALVPRRAPGLERGLDWIGLNFYGRFDVRFDPLTPGEAFGRHVQSPTVRHGDVDWGQPSPQGMVRQLERLATLGVPLYVTENGTPDLDGGGRRGDFLVDHMRAVVEARRAGLDIRGYFHWSLVDNFEWAEGWACPFGLFALDRKTQERHPRPAAEIYQQICRSRQVP